MEETANVVRNGTITGMDTTHFIFTRGLTATLTKQKKFSSFLSKIKITHNFALFFSDFFVRIFVSFLRRRHNRNLIGQMVDRFGQRQQMLNGLYQDLLPSRTPSTCQSHQVVFFELFLILQITSFQVFVCSVAKGQALRHFGFFSIF